MMETPLDALRFVLILSVIGMAVSTLEFWVVAGAFGDKGAYSWRIQQLRSGVPRDPWISVILSKILSENGVRVLLIQRILLLAAAIFVPFGNWLFAVILGTLVLNNLVFTWRRGGYGDDGSDQMNAIILLTIFLTVGPHSTPVILQIGLWFIALQACLSYTTAGVAKLVSPIWRSGDAIYKIFNTSAYGLRQVADVLEHRRWLNLFLCWTVILVETLFPLALLLPEPWGWTFIAWGVLFHLLNAIIMGLNSFLWAFLATYPAIVYTSSQVHAALGSGGFVREVLGL